MENFHNLRSHSSISVAVAFINREAVEPREFRMALGDIYGAGGLFSHRYVTEDVPYGMVPIASIGKMLGIPTPGMDAMIQTASMANGVDYLSSGRNADTLGLRGESVRELLDFVIKGE